MTHVKGWQTVHPSKIYTSLARACRYGGVLPNYAQPVYKTDDGLSFQCVGWAIGPAKKGDTWIAYRAVTQ